MSEQQPKLAIISPKVGTVPLKTPPKVRVQVQVTGAAKVTAVTAEGYQERPPKEPKHKLARGNKPGIYEGAIPIFPGKFRIAARVMFEEAPPAGADAGYYVGEYVAGAGGGANTVDILSPLPGPVLLGMDDGLDVRVFAEGPDPVLSVVAHGLTSSGVLGIEEELMQDPGAPNEYTGRISGRVGTFRIKAKANFDSAGELSDEKGDYTGQAPEPPP
jgi:hypothetical protein